MRVYIYFIWLMSELGLEAQPHYLLDCIDFNVDTTL